MLLAAPGAGAAVVPAAEAAPPPARLALTTSSAWVTVRSHPFALAIGARHDGVRSPGLSTFRGDREAGGVRYAAVTYTAGPEPELRYPELPGQSPDPPAPETPRRYRGVDVVAATHRGRALSLVLSTDDPARRRIRLRVAPGRAGIVAIRAKVTRARRVSAVAFAFSSDRREAFHGLGGRRESTDLHGRDIKTWVLDYRFPDASTGYYAPQAGLISSRDYGALLAGDRIARWRLDADLPRAWRVSRADASMRLLLAPGPPARAIRALTAITGRHRLPPRWSTGPTLSRTIGILHDGGDVYRRKVEADVRRLVRGRLPVSAYAFEGWATLPPGFVRRVIRRLAARHVRSVLYLRSFVADDTAGTERPGVYAHAITHGYVATTRSGAPFLQPSPFPGGQAAVVDFTDPGARRWWRARVAALLDTGARGFMNDFGEQVLPAMRFHDGETGVTMHNHYPVLQARVTRRAIATWERAHPGHHAFFFQRAGFSGDPGSAAYENAEFPGDETADWQRGTGLASIVPDMLNRAVGGAPGFTSDIGGYAQFTPAEPVLPPTGRELFVRWSEAAALTPFFRVHNSGLSGARMPWSYDPRTLRTWMAMARLHRRAQPLMRRLWRRFTRTGMPMIRPLWLAGGAAARSPRNDDEWLVGRNLLAAPVLHEGARSRPILLPPGCWRRHATGRGLRGGRTITAVAPMAVLPWYARCGTAPLGRP